MSQMPVFLDAVDSTDEVIIKWNSLGNASDNPQRATHISCPDSLTLNNFQRSEWKGKNTEKCPWPYNFISHYPLQYVAPLMRVKIPNRS